MLHQVARFSSIVPFVEEVGGGDLLDVGSGASGVAGWLSDRWRVTALDRTFDIAGAMAGPRPRAIRRIAGDARRLPVADRAYDVVLALDVLEHVAPADRHGVLEELVRAARRRVIAACPTGPAALAADRRLTARLRARGLTPPSWLVEHELNGFPEAAELERALAPHGRLRMIGNENLRWHAWVFGFEHRRPGAHVSRRAAGLIAAGSAAGGVAAAFSRLGMRVARGPQRPPSYRTIAVLDLS